MSSNLILQANFVTNPFTAVAGVYNGLFAPTNGVSGESSGFFTAALPANGSGAYSGKLLLGGNSYPFSGTFALSGNTQAILASSSKAPFTMALHLNLNSPDDRMTGTVIKSAGSSWTSELRADRVVFNAKSNPATNYVGEYTLIIPPGSSAPTNEPGGYGYATLINTLAGGVALGGSLADNTAISESAAVSKDGIIPLYNYSKKGLLLGWLTLGNETVAGTNLAWIKTNVPGALYAAGFTNTNVAVLGSLYISPSTGASALNLTNGTLTIGDGGLLDTLIYSNLSVTGEKLITNGTPTNKLTGVITRGTGILTVTFRPTGAKADVTAKGVVLQDTSFSTNAAGWFPGASQSGYFLLQQ
jgi:hypothetical protein